MSKGGAVRLFFMEKPMSLSLEKEAVKEMIEQGDPALKYK